MRRVAVIAALPGELRPLVRGWRHESRRGVELWRRRRGETEWIAACAGAGQKAALRAWHEIEQTGAIDAVISTGWAGALRAGLAAGRVYRVAGVVDARTGERFATEQIRELVAPAPVESAGGETRPGAPENGAIWLVTLERVANRQDKPRLAAAHGAGLVDMEAAAVAGAARARGLPFHCVKGVSDGPEDRLPDFNRFITAEGEFRLGPFMGFAALRPWTWRPLLRLGAPSRRSAQALRPAVLRLLDELET